MSGGMLEGSWTKGSNKRPGPYVTLETLPLMQRLQRVPQVKGRMLSETPGLPVNVRDDRFAKVMFFVVCFCLFYLHRPFNISCFALPMCQCVEMTQNVSKSTEMDPASFWHRSPSIETS